MSRVTNRPPSLMIRTSAPSPGESNTSSDDPSLTQVAVSNKMTSKLLPALNAGGGLAPIKGNMSCSSETQLDNYELQARTDPHHIETSQAGQLSQLAIPVSLTSDNPVDPATIVRADASYQAPLPAAVPIVNPLLKRVADSMPLSLAPPQKKKCPLPTKKVASKLRIHGSEEDAVLSQGSASPLEPMAPLAVTVDLSSSETRSDTGMGLHREPPVPLQVELSQIFPPRGPNPVVEEFRQREGKTIALPGYPGKYLTTPYRIPNFHKFHYHLAKPMISKRMAT
ncbi:hypothetical protein LIER_08293 [Lithospermum erythrorhizon]|uniref:Uncharacterized protein n=1 Tax=Lithospermum erythrorhizon TaxID=34254 RepID=A0AAV3PD13_LITER